MGFPEGHNHWVQWVRFALQKLSVTWQSRGIFLCIPFLAIVVRSVTTEVVTLRDNSNDYFATHSGWLGYSKKTKWELVIRDKNFLDLNTWLSLVDTRFVLLFLEFTKKILASVYERSLKFDSSPSEKPLLKILAARWFLLSWAFALKKHERSEFIELLGGFGGLAPEQDHRWEFITVVWKSTLCVSLLISFKPLNFFPVIWRNCPSTKLA